MTFETTLKTGEKIVTSRILVHVGTPDGPLATVQGAVPTQTQGDALLAMTAPDTFSIVAGTAGDSQWDIQVGTDQGAVTVTILAHVTAVEPNVLVPEVQFGTPEPQ